MKKIAYLPIESSKSLITILLKLIHDKKDVFMLLKQEEKVLEMSEFLWKSHKFVPHAIEGEEFSEMQPIIITSKPIERSTGIIFEEEKVDFKVETLILWNKKPISSDFLIYYQQPDLSWQKA